jgi:lysophospholipase L1-like esterase
MSGVLARYPPRADTNDRGPRAVGHLVGYPPDMTPGSRPPAAALRMAVLGDSIGYGQGASRSDDTLGRLLVRALEEHDITTDLRVFAVPGTRSAGLGPQVERAVAWAPDVAVLVIGANDLTHFVPVASAVADFRDAVRRLRSAGCEVVVAPAPDLSAVPHVPAQLRAQVQRARTRLREEQVAVAVELGARVADRDGATARAFAADHSLFCADLFHPSSAGYAVIAHALFPEVLAAAQAGGDSVRAAPA